MKKAKSKMQKVKCKMLFKSLFYIFAFLKVILTFFVFLLYSSFKSLFDFCSRCLHLGGWSDTDQVYSALLHYIVSSVPNRKRYQSQLEFAFKKVFPFLKVFFAFQQSFLLFSKVFSFLLLKSFFCFLAVLKVFLT